MRYIKAFTITLPIVTAIVGYVLAMAYWAEVVILITAVALLFGIVYAVVLENI